MRLITIATHSDLYFPFLKKSCRKYDSPITVLGWKQTWPGFSFKSKLIKEYLIDVPDDEIVCVIDSFDVVLLRPIKELEEFFINYSKQTGVRIIVGFDIAPSIIVSTIAKCNFGTCHGISINAGTYIGYTKDIKNMINEIYINASLDDQILLTKYIKKYPHLVHIDTSSLFFITVNNPFGEFMFDDHIKVQNEILFYRGIRPFFAHGNGNTDMTRLIKELGYNINKKTINYLLHRSREAQINKLINYSISSNYHFIIIGILIMFVIWYLYKSYRLNI